ncbi:MAG TPA: hypothetical protein VN700_00445 [Vicinamibacterales bacterium]|nr:hypothetical protein [Vicinamibacterales bacterium]
MAHIRSLMLGCALVAATAGCNKSQETTTTPTTGGATSFTQVFTGTLQPRGSASYAFSLGSSLPVRLSLGSLTDLNENPLLNSLTMTFGRPQGLGCGALQTVTVQAALATQLLFQPSAGTYCVGISDPGQLSGDALFGIRITQGDPSSTATAGTDTYSSVIFPGGFTSRTFEASAAGTVTVVMDTISPASVSSLFAGVGFPRTDGGGCQLTRTFTASRGAQLAVPVEIGTYCVKLSDPGTLTQLTNFTLRIIHP